ncbi:MAG: sugar kinase, partial [[Eubacterium] saphenum]|nr:sugar kinase [[Eubacterium] saphenum]
DDSKNSRLGIYFYEYGAHPRKPGIVYDRQNTSVNSINLDDYSDEMFKSARCFHTTGITLALGQKTRDAAIEMIKRFKANGALISFDVNFRLNLWSGEEARKCIEQILPYIDIFFCSEDTARLTFGKTGDVYEIMKSFCSEYPISIMCATQRVVHSPKIHTFGSVIYNSKEDKFYEEEPYRNIEVVDRIGSGDAYISGVLAGLLSSNLSCETALKYGNATGSVKNTIVGDLPSSDLKEIKRIIDEHNSTGPQTEMNR